MPQNAEKIRVGLVTDVGRIDDGTFNQYAYEGMTRAVEELGLESTYIETKRQRDGQNNIEKLIANGYNLIITIGAILGEVTEKVANQNPDVKFITVDYAPHPTKENIMAVVFAEDQAGYLAGALAGMITKTGKVGAVGGMEIPPVLKFCRGFERGAKHVNAEVEVLSTYIDSFTDPERGKAAARSFLHQDVDVIFGAGGQTGSGAIMGAAEQGAWVIGVDQDEWVTTFEKGQEPGANKLLSSATKRVDTAVYNALKRAASGEFKGQTVTFDIKDDGVALADFHDADAEITEVERGKLREITLALKEGELTTGILPTGEFEQEKGILAAIRQFNWVEVIIPLLAVFTALVIGAVVIWGTRWVELPAEMSLGEKIIDCLKFVFAAYEGLFMGAFGTRTNFANTLINTTPYVFSGLAVAIGFQCGLFNIGAEGQLYIGALAATLVGYTLQGLPIVIHLPLTIIVGILAGALWGAVPGFLKATTGAHEVINTIMMNYIALRTVDFLVKGPMRDTTASLDRTPYVAESARIPVLWNEVTWAFPLAIATVIFIWWLLYKTTIGFEIRTVGANPTAAKYAGMNVNWNFVLAMGISGALAALAGISVVIGRTSEYSLKAAFSSGLGFDSIAVALLAKSNPIGVFPAAFLWGALRNGAGLMQVRAPGISVDLISIVQGLVIMFVAADEIVRWLYRIKAERKAEAIFTRGWGG